MAGEPVVGSPGLVIELLLITRKFFWGTSMNLLNSRTTILAAMLGTAAMAGCDSIKSTDESPTIARPAATVVINGSVTGLSATRPIELQIVTTNNGLNSGTKTVSFRGTEILKFGAVEVGAGYTITIAKNPVGRACTIANGSGTATANVDNVSVTCIPDGTPLYSLTANIAPALSAAPPEGFAVTLTTEEGSETISPTMGQTSVTFELPVYYPHGLPTFNYTVTASNTVGGTTNKCAVTNPTGSLIHVDGATETDVTNVTVASCLYTISAVAQYAAPPGGAPSAMGAGGLQLGLRSQLTGEIVVQAPVINAYGATAVAFPGTFPSNSSALYEVVVQSHPAGQYCIVQGGGMAQLVTAQANVTAQVRCRNVPVEANQLKGVYQLDTPPIQEVTGQDVPVGAVLPEPRVQTRNFIAFFPNGTFIYGTHHATATAGVEHGFYSYNPGASTLGFQVWTDTNGNPLDFSGAAPPTGTTFSGDFLTAFLPVSRTAGISGRAGYTEAFSFTTFRYGPPGNVTATNVIKTAGAAGMPGRLSMTFGTASSTNLNPTWTLTEPVTTPGQIQGAWTDAENKRVFVYNRTTFYGFHAGVNGAPNLQDACFTILDATVAEGYYSRRGGDTGCMGAITTTAGGDPGDGLTNVGTVDVPNATTTNTTAPLIPGFAGRLPGAITNSVLSPSPIRFKVVAGNPDTLTIQNTLNDNPIGAPVVFTRTTTY